jgi:hypothetical protein
VKSTADPDMIRHYSVSDWLDEPFPVGADERAASTDSELPADD